MPAMCVPPDCLPDRTPDDPSPGITPPPPRERPILRETDGGGGQRETKDPEPRRPGHVGQARQVRVARHALRAARVPCPACTATDGPAHALAARTPTHRTTVSSAHQRFGGVWWLSIVRSALEPDSQVVQPCGRTGKDAHTRGAAPAPGRQPNPPRPPPMLTRHKEEPKHHHGAAHEHTKDEHKTKTRRRECSERTNPVTYTVLLSRDILIRNDSGDSGAMVHGGRVRTFSLLTFSLNTHRTAPPRADCRTRNMGKTEECSP